MKKLVVIILIFSTWSITNLQAQIDLRLSVSNQGQVANSLDKVYSRLSLSTGNGVEEDLNRTFLKYNANGALQFENGNEIRLRIGFGHRNDYLVETSDESYRVVVDAKQQFVELTPSYGLSWTFGKFHFATGLELPIYLIGEQEKFMEEFRNENDPDLSSYYTEKTTTAGGTIVGINNYIYLKASLFNSFYMFSEFNFGLMYADIGGVTSFESNREEVEKEPSEISFNETYLSAFQIQLGIGFTFGTKSE